MIRDCLTPLKPLDEHFAEAKDILNTWLDNGSTPPDERDITGNFESLVEMVAVGLARCEIIRTKALKLSLKKVRDNALEEAAKVAEGCFMADLERDCGCIPQNEIAKEIRTLKSVRIKSVVQLLGLRMD